MTRRPAEVSAAAWLLLGPTLAALPLLIFFDLLAVAPFALVSAFGQVRTDGGDVYILTVLTGVFVGAPLLIVLCAIGTLRRSRLAAAGLVVIAAALLPVSLLMDANPQAAATVAAMGIAVLLLLAQPASRAWLIKEPR